MTQTSLRRAAEGAQLRRRFDGFGARGTDLYTLVWVRVLETKGTRTGILRLRLGPVNAGLRPADDCSHNCKSGFFLGMKTLPLAILRCPV